MHIKRMYSKTPALKNARFRGQRALVVDALSRVSGTTTLEALVPAVDAGGRYVSLLNDWARANGGVRGSVLYHLRALKRLGMVEEIHSAPSARTQVVGWGNSQAVRIPKAMLDELQIREGDEVQLKIEKGRLAVEPVNSKVTLDSLVAAITPKNRHKECDWGVPVGNEIW